MSLFIRHNVISIRSSDIFFCCDYETRLILRTESEKKNWDCYNISISFINNYRNKIIRSIVECNSFEDTLVFIVSFTRVYSIYFRVILFLDKLCQSSGHSSTDIASCVHSGMSILFANPKSSRNNIIELYIQTVYLHEMYPHPNASICVFLFLLCVPSLSLWTPPPPSPPLFSPPPNTVTKKGRERPRNISLYHQLCMNSVSMIVTLLYRACYST